MPLGPGAGHIELVEGDRRDAVGVRGGGLAVVALEPWLTHGTAAAEGAGVIGVGGGPGKTTPRVWYSGAIHSAPWWVKRMGWYM